MGKKESGKVARGGVFGRWEVVGEPILTPGGERKWLCRCTCGTERYVLERGLLYGGSESCGCLRKERSAEASFRDLTGKVFGELTVLQQITGPEVKKGTLWLCKCSCGAEYKILGTLLVTGRRTRCSGKAHKKKYYFKDITGQRFERLTALHRVEGQHGGRSVMWRCKCDCGNEIDASYNELVYCSTKSCGCQKKEHNRKLKDLLVHMDGTSLDMIKSKKVPTDNTTGYRGVYLIRGKYTAKIVFQKKAYHLGSFDRIEDAIQARLEAEELLFDGTAEFYEKWNAKAKEDPVWAAENPVRISVVKDQKRGLLVDFLPEGI